MLWVRQTVFHVTFGGQSRGLSENCPLPQLCRTADAYDRYHQCDVELGQVDIISALYSGPRIWKLEQSSWSGDISAESFTIQNRLNVYHHHHHHLYFRQQAHSTKTQLKTVGTHTKTVVP